MGTGVTDVKVEVWDNDGGWSQDERMGEVHFKPTYPGFRNTWYTITDLGSDNQGGGRVFVSASYS